jgi:hypothetical protein
MSSTADVYFFVPDVDGNNSYLWGGLKKKCNENLQSRGR